MRSRRKRGFKSYGHSKHAFKRRRRGGTRVAKYGSIRGGIRL